MATRSSSRRSAPSADASHPPPELTEYGPPEWRRPWSRTADLGYPDYAPPSEHDGEEMSETLVKNGFKGRSLLNAAGLETFNAHNLIHDGFAKHGQIHLHMLGQLMHDVTARQAESRPQAQVGPSTYRLPPKVTVQDSKRDAWIADLANPNVPLSKLSAGSIPHPFKGHDLLDMLHKNAIPIERAVWYVRVLGAHETHLMRNRPNFNPAQHSIDWTNVVTSHLKKQLSEIMLPTPFRPGLTHSIRQGGFQGILGDPETRQRWISRFTYSLALLHEFISDLLVDIPTLMSWLVPLTLTSNIAQLEFVLRIAEAYTDLLMANRAWLGPFVEACCVRLGEIEGNPLKAHLAELASDLGTFLQRALLTQPDVYTFPRLVQTHGATLKRVFTDSETAMECARQMAQHEPHLKEICRELVRAWEGVERKVDALLFKTLPPREATPPPLDSGAEVEGERNASLRLTLADIKLLNRIGPSTHLADLDFFSVPSSSSSSGTSSAHHTGTATHPTTSPTTPNPHNQSAPSPTSPSTTTPAQPSSLASASAHAFTFRAKLHTLLTWAATSQCGSHKHYAAASLLVRWRERRELEIAEEDREDDNDERGGLLSANPNSNSPRPDLDLAPYPRPMGSSSVPATATAAPAAFRPGPPAPTPASTATTTNPHPLHLQTKLKPKPRQRAEPPLALLQRELASWLDTSDIALDRAQHGHSVALLYGELVRRGLVSYGAMIRRVVVARGCAKNRLDEDGRDDVALHREEYARLIPLVDPGPHHLSSGRASLRAERIAALYGMSGDRGEEEEVENELKIKLVLALPAFFPDWELGEVELDPPAALEEGEEPASSPPPPVSSISVPGATPFILSEIGHRWLLPAVWRYLGTNAHPDGIPPHVFCYIARCLASFMCHQALLELCLHILRHASSPEMLQAVVDTLLMHLDIWTSMDIIDELISTLTAHMMALDARGAPTRQISVFLREVGAIRQASEGTAAAGEIGVSGSATQAKDDTDGIFVLPEITALAAAGAMLPPIDLVSTLQNTYGPQNKWTHILWESVVGAIQLIPRPTTDAEMGYVGDDDGAVARLFRVLSDASMGHLSSFEHESLMWFQGRGHRLLSTFDEGIWSSIELILFRLVVCGSLSTWTVLQGLVFPTWASGIADDSVAPPIAAVQGANSIARRLLLVYTPLPVVVHDTDADVLVEAQRLLGQHGVIHTRAETIAFFTAISHLAQLEDRKGLPQHVQAASSALRIGICSCVTFRCLAIRYIEDVRGILCRSTSIDATGAASEDTLVETLAMLIMPQDCSSGGITATSRHGTFDIDAILPLMTPWNFSTAMIELQLSFKRLSIALTIEEERALAEKSISAFAAGFFEHTLDPEQTDLVADVLRGMNGLLAERFFNSGFERVAHLLSDLHDASEAAEMDDFLRSAGEVVRLLVSVLHPLRTGGAVPTLTTSVHRNFGAELGSCFEVAAIAVAEAEEDDDAAPSLHRLSERIILLLRLAQFHAGFRAAETSAPVILTRVRVLVRIITAFYSQSSLRADSVIISAVLDTIALLLSECPTKATQTTSRHAVEKASAPDHSALGAVLPRHVQRRLDFLMPFESRDWRVSGLYMAKKAINTTRLLVGESVQSRPWDWSTYTPIASGASDTKQHSPSGTQPLLNNTSISLEHFVVRVTGERVRPRSEPQMSRVDAELRNGEDRFHSESVYERDWREGRVGWTAHGADSSSDTSEDPRTPATAVTAASPLDNARSPLTSASAGGRSSAPVSPISASSGGAGRIPKTQHSSLRNEIRMPAEKDYGAETSAVGFSATRGQKRKADPSDIDVNSALPGSQTLPSNSLSSARRGGYVASAVNDAGSSGVRVNRPGVATAVSVRVPAPRPSAPAGSSVAPAAASQPPTRHPLPPKPQFASIPTSSSSATAQSRGVVSSAATGAGAVKRKRDAVSGGTSLGTASPSTIVDAKKRRTLPDG